MARPDAYVLSFPELEGYAPIPDARVRVDVGETIRVRVDLVNAR